MHILVHHVGVNTATVHVITAHSSELVSLRSILLHLLVDLYLEFFQLLLNFVVHVALVHQEVIRVVLLLLLWVVNVLAELPDMINGGLNHAGGSDILTECLVALQLSLRSHLRVIHSRTVGHVHFSLVPRVVHVITKALVLRRIVQLLSISLLHSRLGNRCCTGTSCGLRTSSSFTLAWRVCNLRALLCFLEPWRITRLVCEQPMLLFSWRLIIERWMILG